MLFTRTELNKSPREQWLFQLRLQSRRTCTHLLLQELQNCNSLMNNHQKEYIGSHQNTHTHTHTHTHSRTKEKPQQDNRRSEIALRIKPHTFQRCSVGSNKALCTPGPRDSTGDWARHVFECVSVSCGGAGQWWPAMGTRALAIADVRSQHVAQILLEEVAIKPTIEPPSRQPTNWRTAISKKSLHCCKCSRPHDRFPILETWERTENPQGIWLWRPVGFGYRISTELGKKNLEGHNQCRKSV